MAGHRTSKEVDKKFGNVINLLSMSRFRKDFSSKDSMSDLKSCDKSESPLTILYALKKDLHAKVQFPSFTLPLNADGL